MENAIKHHKRNYTVPTHDTRQLINKPKPHQFGVHECTDDTGTNFKTLEA